MDSAASAGSRSVSGRSSSCGNTPGQMPASERPAGAGCPARTGLCGDQQPRQVQQKGVLQRLFPALTLHAFVMEEPSVRTSKDTTAVIRYRCHEEFTMNGERTEGTFSVTATYTFTNNRSRLSAWQINPVS